MNINKVLIIFLFSHLIIWTLIPSISNDNLPLDTIEALAWGSNLDWGYNKHPPLSAWSVEVFYQLFKNQDWSYYFLSQLFVISSFFIVWKFSEDFFKSKIYSLVSVLLLEGIYFFNFTTPEFNVYVCQLPFRALVVYFCWKSFKNNDTTSWLLFGFFAALGFLSHYLFLYLLVAILIFYLIVLSKKKKFNLKYLIPGTVFLLVLLPHLIWLKENNYATLIYALHRTGLEESIFLDHLFYPLLLLGKQIGILTPFFIMLLLMVSKFKKKFNLKDNKLLFLLTINIVPIILILLTSLLMGVKIKTIWMSPFYLFMGVLFVYIFQSKIAVNKLKYFFLTFLILFILSPTVYYFISTTQTDKRTDYSGKKIAKLVQQEWDNIIKSDELIVHKKIEVVGWDEWYAGNLSYYLGGIKRPKVYTDNFSQAVAYKKEKNFILITKSQIANKVCLLTSEETIKYLTFIKNIANHNVCFLILKEDKQ